MQWGPHPRTHAQPIKIGPKAGGASVAVLVCVSSRRQLSASHRWVASATSSWRRRMSSPALIAVLADQL